jgi:hypothetical protein
VGNGHGKNNQNENEYVPKKNQDKNKKENTEELIQNMANSAYF